MTTLSVLQIFLILSTLLTQDQLGFLFFLFPLDLSLFAHYADTVAAEDDDKESEKASKHRPNDHLIVYFVGVSSGVVGLVLAHTLINDRDGASFARNNRGKG